jgi:hypothetical protein
VILEIKHWLQHSGSFEMGRALLQASCDAGYGDSFVLKLCASGANTYNRKKLVEELNRIFKLLDDGKAVPLQKSVTLKKQIPKTTAKAYEPKKPVPVESLPEDLKELDRQIKAWYAQNRIMRGQLRELVYLPTGAVRSTRSLSRTAARRYELCEMVVNTQKKINAAWARIDYYGAHNVHKPGTEPATEKEIVKKWLQHQPQAINYIRQADSLHRRTGEYKDKTKYNHYTKMLEDIKTYINEG